jgi:hypothetical protein
VLSSGSLDERRIYNAKGMSKRLSKRINGFTTIRRAIDNATVKALVEAGDLPGTLWRQNLLTEETL